MFVTDHKYVSYIHELSIFIKIAEALFSFTMKSYKKTYLSENLYKRYICHILQINALATYLLFLSCLLTLILMSF